MRKIYGYFYRFEEALNTRIEALITGATRSSTKVCTEITADKCAALQAHLGNAFRREVRRGREGEGKGADVLSEVAHTR